MTKLRKLMIDYMWNIFLFFILCGIGIFAAMMIYKDIKFAYGQMIFIIPFFANIEIRRRSKKLLFFLSATIMVFASSAFVGYLLEIDYPYYLIYICVFMTIITISSISIRFGSNQQDISVPFLVLAISINAVLSIASGHFDVPELESIYIFFSITQISLFIIYVRIKRLDTSLELIESTSIQPIGRIIGFNNMLTVIFTIIIVLTGIVSVMLGFKNIIIYILGALLNLIRFLAGLTKSEQAPLEEILPPEMPQNQGGDMSMFGEPKDPSLLIIILEKIFIYASSLMLIAIIILGIGYICFKIYKKFSATIPENGDEKEFLFQDILVLRAGDMISNLRSFFNELLPTGDNAKKVRRIYYKRVSSYISQGIDIEPKDTAADIRVKIKEKEDLSHLTQTYIKARYSNLTITDSDIGACKK